MPFGIDDALMIGAAAAPIVSNIIGFLAGGGDRDQARQLMEEASRQYNIPLPQLQQMVAEQVGPSAMGSLSTAPEQAVQREALADLQRMGEGAGDIEFRGATAQAQREGNRAQGARNAAVYQAMQARGMGGSGMEWALRQQAAQDSANAQGAAGFNAAMEGRQQAFRALQARAGLAGTMRGQSAGEQETRARAADELARFNAGARERANAYNLGLPQQQFGNALGLAGARSGALQGQAGYLQGQAGNTANAWNQAGQGAGYAAGSAYNNRQNQQTQEELLRQLRTGGR